MSANRPVASAKANPRTAYAKSWPVRHINISSVQTMYRRGIITSKGWVAGHSLDQGTEHRTDTNTSTSEANGGHTGTLHLSSSDQRRSRCLSDNASGLHGVAGEA